MVHVVWGRQYLIALASIGRSGGGASRAFPTRENPYSFAVTGERKATSTA